LIAREPYRALLLNCAARVFKSLAPTVSEDAGLDDNLDRRELDLRGLGLGLLLFKLLFVRQLAVVFLREVGLGAISSSVKAQRSAVVNRRV